MTQLQCRYTSSKKETSQSPTHLHVTLPGKTVTDTNRGQSFISIRENSSLRQAWKSGKGVRAHFPHEGTGLGCKSRLCSPESLCQPESVSSAHSHAEEKLSPLKTFPLLDFNNMKTPNALLSFLLLCNSVI